MSIGFVTRKQWEKNPLREGKFRFAFSLIASFIMVIFHAVFPSFFASWETVFMIMAVVVGWGTLCFVMGLIGNTIKKKQDLQKH